MGVNRSRSAEVFPLEIPLSGDCGVCGVHGRHNYFDAWLRDLICVGCWTPLMTAQIEARAWMTRAALRSPAELRVAIANFELVRRKLIGGAK